MRKLKLTAQVPTEGDEQTALMDWSQAASRRFPELALLYAIPNGVPISGPQKFAIINAFKRRGLKPGVPDLCLPVARGGYHGLYIEMKRVKGGVLSHDQEWWMSSLINQGYKAVACPGFQQAAETITAYLLGR